MTKDKLQKHYTFLEKTLSDFLKKEKFYINGKSSKIRKRSLVYLNVYITRFKKYVTDDIEIYNLLTGEKETETERAALWDEISSVQSFGKEMTKALKKTEQMLSEME
jgi:hypothetical protein